MLDAIQGIRREQVAVGLLVGAGCVLLGLRAAERPYGDLWALPGGHVEPGESRREAVVRELGEELGIRARVQADLPLATSTIGPVEHSIWLIADWTGDVANKAPDEHDELQWLDVTHLSKVALAHPSDVPVIVSVLRR